VTPGETRSGRVPSIGRWVWALCHESAVEDDLSDRLQSRKEYLIEITGSVCYPGWQPLCKDVYPAPYPGLLTTFDR